MENLWPTLDAKEISGPLTILKEQGQHLEKMTKGVLTYDIDSKVIDAIDNKPFKRLVRIDFYIHAPLLNDYKFLLFYITHDFILTYPLNISIDLVKTSKDINNENDFKAELKKILGSEYTVNVLQRLLSQSQK